MATDFGFNRTEVLRFALFCMPLLWSDCLSSLPQIADYPIPVNVGDVRHLGQLTGAAFGQVCADIAERHHGLVLVITTDMQSAIGLQAEIRQFTQLEVNHLPDWETLPYDSFSPHQDIISARLSLLYRLPTLQRGVLILPINTLMQRVCPHSFIDTHALMMHKGERLSQQNLTRRLIQAGYRHVEQVLSHGEFATRGALLDLFPMGSEQPYRIDFFDDEIDSLRTFDIDTQRSLQQVDAVHLLPAHEFPIDKNSIELFRSQWREKFEVIREPEHLYQQVSKGALPTGIEYWQPLFFNQPLPDLLSYLPTNTLLVTKGEIQDSSQAFWSDIQQRYDNRRVDPMRPLLEPDQVWLRPDTLFTLFKRFPRIKLSSQILKSAAANTNLGYHPLPNIAVAVQLAQPLQALRQFLEQYLAFSVIFSVESQGRREFIQDLLSKLKLRPIEIQQISQAKKPGYYLMIGAADAGFINPELKQIFICENELLGERPLRRQRDSKRVINSEVLIRNLAELSPGQPVVHLEHGVGRYQGLTTLEAGGMQAEYLIVSYADQAKLYVPVSSLSLISRYTGGADDTAPLHKLGSDSWNRARQKAADKVRDVAAELLDIYAQREAKRGFAFQHDKQEYQRFCDDFPYQPTQDQAEAINAVLSDMCQPLAMDRLVCGDVGFGKTEVAMRAAFLAVINHKQVAVLVPTTLLAQQHFDNFRDRFANWPIRIEMLSRFRTAKQQAQLIAEANEGKIDILIGTHKLIISDIGWKDLGLLIVDEEHRFGVRHKERIKAMRADVDILTLTATPIPRTLNMAMSGMRDLSIIATPPARRLAVKTFVREYDELVIREAILRETLRGGQVYYLYNDVANINKAAERLANLVPEARIAIGHGQMRERELEKVMNDFQHQRCNVLICTTIIETGIDIPSANTIIIERADKFGLAQLHQLRGRVGRSHHQAYAWLLTPHPKSLSDDAKKRLQAIEALEDLGAGFALATHDLEIRGAGELLGEGQSGQMENIGFTLYMELLENAVEALKSGKEPSLDDLTRQQTDVELRLPALIPDDYIFDVNTRLSLYKQIASAADDDELMAIRIEMVDRFGKLPEAALNLINTTSLRRKASSLGINKIEASEKGGYLQFGENNRIDPSWLIRLIQQAPQQWKIEGAHRLRFIRDLQHPAERLKWIDELLDLMQQHQLPAQ